MEECGALRAVLLQVSTDYVFDGNAMRPYPQDAPTAPRTAYGRSKLAGERAVLEALPHTGYVVRTAWLFGEHGDSFVRTVIRLAGATGPVEVVDDQRGQPTWTGDRSPTFGKWEGVRLDDQAHHAVYLSEGLGHAFLALTDDTTVVYLCSEGYNPDREHGIPPRSGSRHRMARQRSFPF